MIKLTPGDEIVKPRNIRGSTQQKFISHLWKSLFGVWHVAFYMVTSNPI